MKYFIDLGCYVGDTIAIAIEVYKDCDKYIGFEPVPEAYKKSNKRFKNNHLVEIHNEAADVSTGTKRMYLGCTSKKRNMVGKGSTLCASKSSGGIKANNTIEIKSIDFSKYITDNFKECDYLILKVDIEGLEYDVLEHMVSMGAINYVNELYCEWHQHKIADISEDRHQKLINKLRKRGFDLKGGPISDEFSKIVHKPS